MENTAYMLTTIDNPYNPFTEFSKWYIYDTLHGYNSCGRLALRCRTGQGFTSEEETAAISEAIDEVIKYDPVNIYKKVKESDFKS